MKKFCLLVICSLALFVAAPLARAQGNAKEGQDVMRAADLEKDSLHNLEVARQAFKLRKAYVGALERWEEVLGGNPVFSKIDEILFMAGESSLNLSLGKGKQAASLYVIHDGEKKRSLTPEQLRDLARTYLSQLVTEHPESSFRGRAEEDLKSLRGPKPNDSKQ